MSLRVYAQANIVISQDNSSNPQEITFSSGLKTKTDTATYNESSGNTFDIPAGDPDTKIELGSLTSAELLYCFSSSPGLLIKLVPVGELLADTLAMELVANFPAIIPFKIAEVYVSNPTATDAKLVLGAAGN